MALENITFATLETSATKLKEKEIVIDEWGGGKFILKQVMADQFEAVKRIFAPKVDKEEGEQLSDFEAGVALLTICLFDSDGVLPKAEWLMKQPLFLVQRLMNDAFEINGLSAAQQERMEKNSQ